MIDFAIIGAPKSGTSSLYDWLCEHPELEGARPKETFYFLPLKHPLSTSYSYEHYGKDGIEKFFPCSHEKKIRFEATTHYFYSDDSIKWLASLEGLKFVVFVERDPASRIRSSFQFTKNNRAQISENLSFKMYAESMTKDGLESVRQYFISEKTFSIHRQELEMSRYEYWISKWKEVLGEENVLIFTFEDLIKNPAIVCKRISDKAGAKGFNWEYIEYKPYNKSVNIRNKALHRHVIAASKWLKNFPGRSWLKEKYENFQEREREESYEEGEVILRKYFGNGGEE